MSPVVFWALLVLLIGFAAFVRFYDLRLDPPAYFARGSQDLTTDGAYLTLHAKQAVLFGQWDLFGYSRWTAFKVSLISGVSFLLFKLWGVSRPVADAAGSILNLGGILLFLAALAPGRSRKFTLLLALFLCTSFMLTTYGRQPFAENGLFFLAGLAFWTLARHYERAAGKVIVGVLIALSGLLGKGFGLLLIAGPLIVALRGEKNKRSGDLALLLVPFGITFSVFWFTWYRDQGFFTFLWEHGAGAHGFPHGLTSPAGFIESVISYGRYGLHLYMPVVSLMCLLALASLISDGGARQEGDRSRVFMVSWIVSWILALAPFNYLPVRYLFLLLIPMSVLAAEWLSESKDHSFSRFGRLFSWRAGLLFLLIWTGLYHLSVEWLAREHSPEEYFRIVWWVLPFAVVVTAILVWVLRARTITLGKRAILWLTTFAVAGTIVWEGYSHFEWLRNPQYTIEYGNRDMATLLGDSAVVAGQAGPAFTEDTKIRNFPLFVPPDAAELRSLLTRYPITHMIISSAEWDSLTSADPALFKARTLTRFWVRDAVIAVVRVSDLGLNPESRRYQLTDYERADLAQVHRQADSAEFYLKRVLDVQPECRAALADLYYLGLRQGALSDRRTVVEQIVKALPTDFAAMMLGAIYYRWLARESHTGGFEERSAELLNRAIRLNPRNEMNLRRLYETGRPEDRML